MKGKCYGDGYGMAISKAMAMAISKAMAMAISMAMTLLCISIWRATQNLTLNC